MERALLILNEIPPVKRFQWLRRLGAPVSTTKPELPDSRMRLELMGGLAMQNEVRRCGGRPLDSRVP